MMVLVVDEVAIMPEDPSEEEDQVFNKKEDHSHSKGTLTKDQATQTLDRLLECKLVAGLIPIGSNTLEMRTMTEDLSQLDLKEDNTRDQDYLVTTTSRLGDHIQSTKGLL